MATPYDPGDIQVLEWPDPPRRRPGMFIGDTASPEHVRYMLWYVLGRAVDEHRHNGAQQIDIAIDGARISVADDGLGLAPEAIVPLLTQPHTARGFESIPVTCALSNELVFETWHHGHAYVQRFACGRPVAAVAHLGPTVRHGARVTFEPDTTIISALAWDEAAITSRCRELAALLPGLALAIDDEVVCYPRGLLDHLGYLAGDVALVAPLHVRVEHAGIPIEVAIAYAPDRGHLQGFVNLVECKGSHIDGLHAALRTAFRDRGPWSERLARHLIVIVHVTLEHPMLGPTRTFVRNPEARNAVAGAVGRALHRHFEQAPAFLDAVLLSAL